MGKKIIIAAGGTGGHVFPAICVANALKTKGCDVRFSTDRRGMKYLGIYENSAIIQIVNTSSRARLYASLLKNTLKSFFKLLKNRPDCVIGFGGYPSVPYVLAAQILGIKTIIHEQNAVVGKANKLLSKLANRVIMSFEKVKGLPVSSKTVYIGNPTRFEDEYCIPNHEKNDEDDVFGILVFGGSQGAKVFSDEITDAICNISKLKRLSIYQQARQEDIEKIKQKYSNAGVECVVSGFFHNMNEVYKNVDLVVSRSGASSVFEIIGFRKPSILVPYTKSINDDQEENAKFLERNGASIIVDENNISMSGVFNIIKSLIEDKIKLEDMEKSLENLFVPHITSKIAEEIIDFLRK